MFREGMENKIKLKFSLTKLYIFIKIVVELEMIERKKRVCGLFLIISLALVSLSSLCKKPNDDNYLEPVNVSNDSGRSEHPSIAVDSRGTVHLVWDDNTPGNEEIFYAYKPAGGNWSSPVNISNNAGASRSPCIAIDKNDKIHIAWQDDSPDGQWRIFYSYKSPDSSWSIPETITAMHQSLRPVLSVDSGLGIHLFWFEGFSGEDCRYHYAYKPYGGQWQIQYLFKTQIADYEMKVDNRKGVHIVLDPYGETYYVEKEPDGTWADTVRLSHSPTDWQLSINPSISIANDMSLHIVWTEGDTALYGVAYVQRTSHGAWGQIEAPYKNKIGYSYSKICTGTSGKIYIILALSEIKYGVKDNGVWQEPITLVKNTNCSDGRTTIAIDAEENIYFAWTYSKDSITNNHEIYYIKFKP